MGIRDWLNHSVLDEIGDLRSLLMALIDDIRMRLANINASVGAVAADVQRLHDRLTQPGGLSEAEAQEVAGELQSIADRLTTLDSQTPEA